MVWSFMQTQESGMTYPLTLADHTFLKKQFLRKFQIPWIRIPMTMGIPTYWIMDCSPGIHLRTMLRICLEITGMALSLVLRHFRVRSREKHCFWMGLMTTWTLRTKHHLIRVGKFPSLYG